MRFMTEKSIGICCSRNPLLNAMPFLALLIVTALLFRRQRNASPKNVRFEGVGDGGTVEDPKDEAGTVEKMPGVWVG